MDKIITELLIVIVAVAITVVGLGFVYGWFGSMMAGHPDFLIENPVIYYSPTKNPITSTNSWGFFTLENTGTVDITGVKVTINGTIANIQGAPALNKPLSKGDSTQISITDAKLGSTGRVLVQYTVMFSNGKTITKTQSITVGSP